jgi:hypothetical protein
MPLKEVLTKAKVMSEEKKLEIEKNLEHLKNIIDGTTNIYMLQEKIFTNYGYILGNRGTTRILLNAIITAKSRRKVDTLIWKYYQSINWEVIPISNKWTTIPRLKTRKEIIVECIDILKVSKGNTYRPIIYTLIPQIEGLCRDIVSATGKTSNKLENVLKALENILDGYSKQKQLSHNSKYDPITTDHIFSKLIIEYIFITAYPNTPIKEIRHKNPFLLSRHKILHGNFVTNQVLTKSNLIRLFLVCIYLGDIYYGLKIKKS